MIPGHIKLSQFRGPIMPRTLIRIISTLLVLALSWAQAPIANAAQRRVAILEFRNVTNDNGINSLSPPNEFH
jgi:hypothetical protein